MNNINDNRAEGGTNHNARTRATLYQHRRSFRFSSRNGVNRNQNQGTDQWRPLAVTGSALTGLTSAAASSSSTASPSSLNPAASVFQPTAGSAGSAEPDSTAESAANKRRIAFDPYNDHYVAKATTANLLSTAEPGDAPLIRYEDVVKVFKPAGTAPEALPKGRRAPFTDIPFEDNDDGGLEAALLRAATHCAGFTVWTGNTENHHVARSPVSPLEYPLARNLLESLQPDHPIVDSFGILMRGKPTAILLYERDDTAAAAVSAHSTSVKYLPLGDGSCLPKAQDTHTYVPLTVLHSHRERIQTAAAIQQRGKGGWPKDRLPLEIYEDICSYLPRDDVTSMRLVSKAFETAVGRLSFRTVVVPFNTEIYDMIETDKKIAKGKGRAIDHDLVDNALHWQNAKDDSDGKVYQGHGLRVFQGFGPHIRKFGMSFEILEEQLQQPLVKKRLEEVSSYYGVYAWPSQEYARYQAVARLERAADETSRMKASFANLINVKELALSLDSGLGYIGGRDKSIRAHIFRRATPVFGQSRNDSDHQLESAKSLWSAIHQSFLSLHESDDPLKHQTLQRYSLATDEWPAGLSGSHYADTTQWLSMNGSVLDVANFDTTSYRGHLDERDFKAPKGVLYLTGWQFALMSHSPHLLVPNDLTKDCQEYLMETEWAQRAFLESYMLAVVDNPDIFNKITALNLAKISSRFLPMLSRNDFWSALPQLENLTILVSADWRDVGKDSAGIAVTPRIQPSTAVRLFNKLLAERIATRDSIVTLTIGWIGGGEHAEGIWARNNYVLPAPITNLEDSIEASASKGIIFPSVEHLTLRNCWITPPVIEGLVSKHAGAKLSKLTLDSLSLTAQPRLPAGAAAAHALAAQAIIQQAAAQQAIVQQAAAQHLAAQQLQAAYQQAAPFMPMQFANANPGINTQQRLAAMPEQQRRALARQALLWYQLLPKPPPLSRFMDETHGARSANVQGLVTAHDLLAHARQGRPGYNPIHPVLAHFTNFPLLPMRQGAQQQQNAGPPAPPAPMAPANSHWSIPTREGSWLQVLDNISPGPVLEDYLPHSPHVQHPARREETPLKTIELISCGYVKLPYANHFDQTAIEPQLFINAHPMSQWFQNRAFELAPDMLKTDDRFIGRISQYMPEREINALQFAWGLQEGWTDAEKAEDVEYDGLQRGGTARVTGVVERSMPLTDAAVCGCSRP